MITNKLNDSRKITKDEHTIRTFISSKPYTLVFESYEYSESDSDADLITEYLMPERTPNGDIKNIGIITRTSDITKTTELKYFEPIC